MISIKIILIALIMTYTQAQYRNLTGLMTNMTRGVVCGENEHVGQYPKNAFCCNEKLEDLEDNTYKRLAPNVCWKPRILKNAGRPRCMCNKGFDLKYRGIKN